MCCSTGHERASPDMLPLGSSQSLSTSQQAPRPDSDGDGGERLRGVRRDALRWGGPRAQAGRHVGWPLAGEQQVDVALRALHRRRKGVPVHLQAAAGEAAVTLAAGNTQTASLSICTKCMIDLLANDQTVEASSHNFLRRTSPCVGGINHVMPTYSRELSTMSHSCTLNDLCCHVQCSAVLERQKPVAQKETYRVGFIVADLTAPWCCSAPRAAPQHRCRRRPGRGAPPGRQGKPR